MNLTNEPSRVYRKRLENWHKPSEMRRACDDIFDQIGGADLLNQDLNQTGMNFLTQMWAAASFAEHRGADATRLIPANDQSDFELQFGSRKEQWKFAEVDEPNRRYGFAYAESIRTECVTKAEGHYSEWVRLLVYLDIKEHGIRQREIEASFAAATALAKDAFSEIWIFWKQRSYCVWRDGTRVVQPGGRPGVLEQAEEMRL